MPKVVHFDAERKNIILAFERCILNKPITAVTVRDIAAEAGISHGKIFSYFVNKEEIIKAYAKYIADVYARAFEGITEKVGSKTGSKAELLQSLIGELYEVDKENIVEKLYAQIYILGQYDEAMRAVVLEAYAQWRRSIEIMLKKCHPDASESQARSLLVLVEGILIYRMNDRLSKEEAMRSVADLFVEGEKT